MFSWDNLLPKMTHPQSTGNSFTAAWPTPHPPIDLPRMEKQGVPLTLGECLPSMLLLGKYPRLSSQLCLPLERPQSTTENRHPTIQIYLKTTSANHTPQHQIYPFKVHKKWDMYDAEQLVLSIQV